MTTVKPALKAEKMEGGVRLHPKGDIVASSVEAIKRSLLRAIEDADGRVTLDMALVKVVDSLGITLVLGLFKTCKSKSLDFEVINLNPDIHRVFKLFNLTKFFPVTEAPRD